MGHLQKGLLKCCFSLLFTLFFSSSYAQLSGSYLIDPGGSGDFLTFTEAVDSLKSQGVSAAVTIEAKAGTYNEQFRINEIAGASSTNTITFVSETSTASDVIISFATISSSNYVVYLDSAKHVRFEDLTITSLGSSYTTTVLMARQIKNITFDSCVFNGKDIVSSSTNYAVIRAASLSQDSAFHLLNSQISEGSYGLFYDGNSSNRADYVQVSGNTFTGQSQDAGYFQYIDSLDILENQFSLAAGSKAINVDRSTAVNITKNIIQNDNGPYGIYLTSNPGTASKHIKIVNNSISVNRNSTCHGIYLYATDYTDISFNSILMGTSSNSSSNAIYIENYCEYLSLRNNNIFASGSGRALFVYSNSQVSTLTSDYNNYFASGSVPIYVNFGTYAGAYPDIASFTAATTLDSNSISVNPYFTAFGDLHAANGYLDNAGIAISSITTDIDDEARANPPCIGSDEFVGLAFTPLKGIYTIDSNGSGSRNFESFTSALAALDSFGVDSAVIFNVASDTFNEKVHMKAIIGSSAANTVTFRAASGNVDDVLIEDLVSSSANYTFWIQHSDHVSFRNITFKKNTVTYSTALLISGNASHLQFDSCKFIGYNTTSTSANFSTVRTSSLSNSSHFTFQNCSFINGGRALNLEGVNGGKLDSVTVFNNSFTDIGYAGMYLRYLDGADLDSNDHVAGTCTYGIYIDNVTGYLIKNNSVEISNGVHGISIRSSSGSASEHCSIINNNVSINRSNNCYGMYLYNSDYVDFYFNSIYLGASTISGSAGIYFDNYCEHLISKNNCIYSAGSGRAIYNYGHSTFSTFTSDHNNYYTTGLYVIRVDQGGNSGSYSSLASFISSTNKDSNSLTVNPYYTAFGDLHGANPYLDNAGTAISGISTDFEGDARSTPPCIGADEFIATPIVPMKGTYTIDSAGSGVRNFLSFTKAVAALDTFGIDSAVEFVVATDTFIEKVKLTQVNGTSEQNTITFRSASGNAADVMIEDLVSSSANYTFWIQNADHIVFKNITFKKNTATYSTALYISGNVNYLTLDSCQFIGRTTTSSSVNFSVLRTASLANNNHFTITNCSFENGSNGMYLSGSSTTSRLDSVVIANNTFSSFYYTGMHIRYCGAVTADSNTLSTSSTSYGIFFNNVRNYTVKRNTVVITNGAHGISLQSSSGTGGERCYVFNNSVSVNRTNTCHGFYLYNSDYIDLDFNSVYVGSSTNSSSTGFYMDIYCEFNELRNNNIYNSSAGLAYRNYGNTTFSTSNSDYNNFYTAGANVVYIQAGGFAGYYADLATYQAATTQDSNSIRVIPYYTSFGDLHASNPYLDNAGIAISGITTDFEGEVRSDPPCIGADEYDVPPIVPMKGIYTIDSAGSGSRNFLSFTEAVASLDTFGIDSNVVFVVASDTFIEKVKLTTVNGASAANTITFRSASGNADDVLVEDLVSSTANYSFWIEHADYITFKNISFKKDVATYSTALLLSGSVTNLTFDSCKFIGRSTTSTSNNMAVFRTSSMANNSNLVITNCTFENGSNSMYLFGASTSDRIDTVNLSNNTFLNFRNVGIFTAYIKDFVVESNSISTTIGNYAVRLENMNHFIFAQNDITSNSMDYGLFITSCNATSGNHNLIYNNSVSLNNSTTCHGMYIYNSDYSDFFYNSVYMGSSANSASNGLYIDIYTENIVLKNNSIYCNGPSRAIRNYGGSTLTTLHSDYNNWFTNGSVLIYVQTGGNAASYSDLSAYQLATSLDSNSVSVNPYYTAFGDLHASNPYLDNAGTDIPSVTSDFDGDGRSDPPCIGADEFAVPPIVPLSGDYTIDSSGIGATNFLSFTDAFAALDTFGIDGVVRFLVASDTFNEQPALNRVNGSSPSNTITFLSASGDNDVLVNTDAATSSNNYTMSITHADYIAFKHINFKNSTSANYNTVMYLGGTVSNLIIDSCNFTGKSTTSTGDAYNLIHAQLNTDSVNVIRNSNFYNGSRAIRYYSAGTSNRGQNITFQNDSAFDFSYTGIQVYYVHNLDVSNCYFSTSVSGSRGITIDQGARFTFSKNKIWLQNGSRGIKVYSSDGTSSARSLIANNFIYSNNTFTYGIDNQYCDYLDVYHNSVYLGASTNSNSICNYVYTVNNVNNHNNIFMNSGTGRALYLQSPGGVASDYNDLFTNGTNLCATSSTNYTTLAAWITFGKDSNSLNVDPSFVSTSDLHASTTDLYNAGKESVRTVVPDDIDDDLRSVNKPCLGADEFTPFFAHDVSIYNLITPTTECGLTKVPIRVEIKNTGNSSEDTIPLAYSLNGGSIVIDTMFTNIGPNATATFEFPDSIDVTGLSTFDFKIYTSLSTDGNSANDTSDATYTNHSAWTHTLTNDTSICYGSNIILQATGANYFTWSNGRTTSYNSVNIYGDVSYSVIMENLLGCLRYDTVNITVKSKPSLTFTGETGFSNSFTDPDVATSSTPITFKVKYTHSENSAPSSGYPYAQLDRNNNYVFNDFTDLSYGTIEEDADDTDYTDGKIYLVTTTLPEYDFYRTRFYAESENGCMSASSYRSEPLIDNDLVDLKIWANDISFSDINPDTNEIISISATIHNTSNYDAESFDVRMYEEDTLRYTTQVTRLLANTDTTITWYHSFPIDEFYPIRVVVDTLDAIEEDNEGNNFAIRPVLVGDFALSASIIFNANFTDTTPCKGTYLSYSGTANYDSVASSDTRVQGATIEFEINETGAKYQTYTNSNGEASLSFRAPTATGTYTISGTITDYTLISTFEDTFTVVDCYNPYDIMATIEFDSTVVVQGDSSNGMATIKNIGDSTVRDFATKAFSNFHGQLFDTTLAELKPDSSITIPLKQIFTTIGTYAAQIHTDYTHKYSERSESNNYDVHYVKVLNPLPDIQPVIHHRYTSNLNTPYNLAYTIYNHGGSSTGLFYVNIFDSTSSGKVLLTRDTVPNLGRCASKGYGQTYSLTPSGCHRLIVEADTNASSGGIVVEFDETNNEDDITLCHVDPILTPDLFTASGYLDVQPVVPQNVGDSLYLSARFFNCGNDSIATGDTIRITYDIILDGLDDTTIVENYMGGLLAGADETSLVLYEVPPHGDHLLRVTLDEQDSVAESNEFNNQAQFPLCWDFDIRHIPSSGTHYVNNVVTLGYSYGNEGLYSGTNVKVDITIDDTNDVRQNIGFIYPTGKQYKGYGSAPRPTNTFSHIFTTTGWHKIFFEIDADSSYIECDETNNIDSMWIYISEQETDLRILSHMINPTELNPDTNELVDIYLTFENIGPVTSDSVTVKCTVNDSLVGSIIKVPGIESGEDTTILVDQQWSDSMNSNSVIRGYLDIYDEITETNELNNIASRAIIVGASTNLRIIDVDYDQSPCSNIEELRDVIVTVINEGDNANNADIGVQFDFYSGSSSIPSIKPNIVFAIGDTVVLTYEDILPPNYITGTSDVYTYAFITNVDVPEFNELDNDYIDTLCTLDLEINTEFTSLDCYNDNDGSANVELVYYKEYDGDNFIYSWRNIDSASADVINITNNFRDTVNNLSAGTYVITAYDGSGRDVSDTFTITQPNELTWTSMIDTSDCAGAVYLDISGGIPTDTSIVGLDTTFGYTTAWTCQDPSVLIPYPTQEDLIQVPPGQYYVTITDDNGCEGKDTFNLSLTVVDIADSTEISSCAYKDTSDWTTVLRVGEKQRITDIFDVHPDSTSAGVDVPINDSVYLANTTYYAGRIYHLMETDTVGRSSFSVRLYYTQGEVDSLIAKNDSLNSVNDIVVHRYLGINTNLDISDNSTDTSNWFEYIPTVVMINGNYRFEVITEDFGEFYLSHQTDTPLNDVPVPVTMLSFEAYAIDNDGLLIWQTASEINNSHFEVQRSKDGLNWTKIGTVEGNGTTNSISSYSYTDVDAKFFSNTVIYRLRQVDYDNQFAYTQERIIEFGDEINMVVYPVPARNELHLKVTERERIERIEVLGTGGNYVELTQPVATKGNATINVDHLTSGMYFVKVTTSKSVYLRRFTVIR